MADSPGLWRVSDKCVTIICLSQHVLCGSIVEKVTCKSGEELYHQSRDQLRDMLGNSGVRLYSQLQKDKLRVCIEVSSSMNMLMM